MNILKNNKFFCAGTILLKIILIVPSISYAQVLEEITVTAQKREQRSQDVGISVTAFSGEAIKELGFTNSIDISAQTPGLNFGTPVGEGNNPSITMRGVGLNDFNDNNEGPVAVYIDDVYKAALPGLTFQLFDVERVEVLKGPQGTLYGRNTTGGLMHFITRKPTEETEFYGEVTYGSYDQVKSEIVASGALSENVLARLSLAQNRHDGYVENRIGDDPNEAESFAGRLQLLFPVSDTFEGAITLHGARSDANAAAYQHQVTGTAADGVTNIAIGGTDAFGYRDTDDDNFAGDYNRVGALQLDSLGASVKLELDINDSLSLTSVSAVDVVDKFHQEDSDMGPNPFIEPTFTSETQTFTQEIRLNGVTERSDWVLGMYFLSNDVTVGNRLDTTNIGFVHFKVDAEQETESYSLFGQVEYDVSDKWSVIGGLRVYVENKDYQIQNLDLNGVLPNPVFSFNSSTVGDLTEQRNENINGRFELDYRPNDDLLIYTAVARGTKSAGFNLGFPDTTGAFGLNPVGTIPYDEEDLRSVELGFKSTLMNGLARLNAAAYYYDYRDFQALSFQGVTQTIFNTDAEIYGMEFDITMNPWQGWEFLIGGNVMDATAEDVTAQDGTTVRDRTMVLAPELSLNGLARYEWPAFSGHLAVQADFNFQTETFFDIQNHPISAQEAYAIGNLRLGYTTNDGKLKVSAFVNNIADQDYKVYTFDFTGAFAFNQQFYGRPRWFGGTISYEF